VAALESALNSLITLLSRLAGAVDATLTSFVLSVSGLLERIGAPHWFQTALPLTVAVALILLAMRLPGGFGRVYVVLLLLDVIYHIVVPVLQS
jgi:hypothetical protein